MNHSFRLIRKLAREIKYLPLELLWNYPITIHSIETLENDIRTELGKIVPAGCSLMTQPETAHGTLAKYDFLDLTFRVPEHLLLQSNYQSGISLLRQLLPAPDPLDETLMEEIEDFDDLSVLKMLARDVDAGLTLCRILLRSRSPRPFKERSRMNLLTSPEMRLPDGYFPHHLTIRDACLTNAEAVWFHKYFYL
ncbi:hypothetical protein IFO70_16115 [Phormidium tenue FACHB-886]|nr:hypothetical protein [Phormidium tenue FACHB-886]